MRIKKTISKLNLDQNTISLARSYAKSIVDTVMQFIAERTTISVERATLRLFGIEDFSQKHQLPVVNVIVDQLREKNLLSVGATYYLFNAFLQGNDSLTECAAKCSEGKLDITSFEPLPIGIIGKKAYEYAVKTLDKIELNCSRRNEYKSKYPLGQSPYMYLIVATGNIYEDVVQAQNAARAGADIVAVIRSTIQSLLDYVPHGATTEGFGGTYATQENFKIMRNAMDEVSSEISKYIQLVNYSSGLCMPEIAAMGALERLDIMLNDSMYGILFRDINMQRTFVDQHFSRMVHAFAEIVINTGEDNYLTTSDAYEKAHTVLASQLINEQFALKAYMPKHLIGLGHAFEIDPSMKNQFLYELAQAQMAKEIFPDVPLKYMPPTKFMSGDIFKGHVQDAMFNVISTATGQTIHLLGMLTEAIHTPFMHDRFLAVENAKMVFNTLHDFYEEIEFKSNGIIMNRAYAVLNNAVNFLEEVSAKGLMNAIAEGMFADIKRAIDGGKGVDGVILKSKDYFNPFEPLLLKKLSEKKKRNYNQI